MSYSWRKDPYGSIVPPKKDGVYLSIAYGLKDVATAARIFAGEEKGYAYARCGEGNPTVRAFEKDIASLEAGHLDGYDAIASASGMASILLLSLHLASGKKKEIVSSPHIYGGTYSLFTQFLPKLGIRCKMVNDQNDIDEWKKAITEETAFVFIESISNPLVGVSKIEEIAECAHEKQTLLVCDNTVPTPELFKPLYCGADIVIHSTSKAINGASTGLGGAIIADERIIDKMRCSWAVVLGAQMDPDCAKRMHQGLKTLPKRIYKHSENALAIAKFLTTRPEIAQVYYPFLPSSPYYQQALKQNMKAGGPLLAFELKGEIKDAIKFIESLKTVIHTTHLGHNKTIATHPASTTHSKIPKEARERLGISDTLIRISAGCEKEKRFQKVLKDIETALEKTNLK